MIFLHFYYLTFQKRRKELEEASINDGLLLAKSSLNISLLPENEDDRNMASLLSLRPSKSIEETQTNTRSKILNMPALPSSSGLLTSFGGLKKEESLGKSTFLTRQTLGITFKRSKVENSSSLNKTKTAIGDVTEDKNTVDKAEVKDDPNITSSEEVNKDGKDGNENGKNVEDHTIGEPTLKETNTAEGDVKDNSVDKNTTKETKKISLVCDYSSSEEGSDG